MRDELPSWLAHLADEDLQFVKRLVLSSGSLKELAAAYGVSYPTIRLRLDRLIERIRLVDAIPVDDPLTARIRILVAEGTIPSQLGRELLELQRVGSRARSSTSAGAGGDADRRHDRDCDHDRGRDRGRSEPGVESPPSTEPSHPKGADR